jgi:3',5'-cyclic AMP phosphodiesterase CpdA
MRILRSVVAIAAIVVGPTYLLLAQPASKPKPIGILLAAGDVSWCDDNDPKQWKTYANRTGDIIRQVIKDAKAETPPIPVRVLALGDLGYPDGTREQMDCFRRRWSGFDAELLPVPGNHEHRAKNPDGKPYFDHFSKYGPFINKDGKQVPLVKAEGDKAGFYAINFPGESGPWRLIALNTYVGGTKKGKAEDKKRRIAMKAQLEWLERKLDLANADNNQACVLAFWHPPTFTSGRHGHVDYNDPQPGAALSNERSMQAALKVLYRHGASVVLAGHEHNYEQFKRHDADGKPAADGVRAFVVGTGGTHLTEDFYDIKEESSDGIYGKDNGTQGVLKIELFDNRYEWEFLPIEKFEGKDKPPTKKVLKLNTVKDDCNTRKKASG